MFRGRPSAKNPLQPLIPSSALTKKLPTKQRTPCSQNGQARRRPVEPPGFSTKVYLDFVFRTFNCSPRRIGLKSTHLSLLSGRTKDAARNRLSSSLYRLCRREVSHRRLLVCASPWVRDTALAPQRLCRPTRHPCEGEREVQLSPCLA